MGAKGSTKTFKTWDGSIFCRLVVHVHLYKLKLPLCLWKCSLPLSVEYRAWLAFWSFIYFLPTQVKCLKSYIDHITKIWLDYGWMLSQKRDRPSMLPRQAVEFQRGLNPFPHLVSIAFLVLMFPLSDIVYLVSFFVQKYFMMFILLSCRGNSASSICNFESWSINQSWIWWHSKFVCISYGSDRGSFAPINQWEIK